MKRIIILSLICLSSYSQQAHSEAAKCGIYDVLGTVKLKKGNVFVDVDSGSSKQVSLKVLNAPLSLKLLESFSVKLKLDVKKVRGQNLEAKYVWSKEEIEVVPGENVSKATLEKEHECAPSKAISKNHYDTTDGEKKSN